MEDTAVPTTLSLHDGNFQAIAAKAKVYVGAVCHAVHPDCLCLKIGEEYKQVHFREPGLSHKGTITSESRAVFAGGMTSYMEMPTVNPATTTIDALEKKHQSQLPVLHTTTEKELGLFEIGLGKNRQITAKACIHNLWFSDGDYPRSGNLIKCNPAIKPSTDRDALIRALSSKQIDIIATDHAPHTLEEKQANYNHAPAGLPLVDHVLLSLFDHLKYQHLDLTQVVEKTAYGYLMAGT
jgi:dihydroorotase-like cyclic amidohydrolase